MTIDVDGSAKTVGIHRIHMEEYAGKLLHEGFRDAEIALAPDRQPKSTPVRARV